MKLHVARARARAAPQSRYAMLCHAAALLQAFDATANPYLGLAALVVAGLQGIKKGMMLPPALDADPSECRRVRAGVREGRTLSLQLVASSLTVCYLLRGCEDDCRGHGHLHSLGGAVGVGAGGLAALKSRSSTHVSLRPWLLHQSLAGR